MVEVAAIETMVFDRTLCERERERQPQRPQLVQQAPVVQETEEEAEAREAAERQAAARPERTAIHYARTGQSGIISAGRRGDPDPVIVEPRAG